MAHRSNERYRADVINLLILLYVFRHCASLFSSPMRQLFQWYQDDCYLNVALPREE